MDDPQSNQGYVDVFYAVVWDKRGVKMYICISDQGYKGSVCADTLYRNPQVYLIKSERPLSNEMIRHLLEIFAKTRKSPKIVGVFGDVMDGHDEILEYEDILSGYTRLANS